MADEPTEQQRGFWSSVWNSPVLAPVRVPLGIFRTSPEEALRNQLFRQAREEARAERVAAREERRAARRGENIEAQEVAPTQFSSDVPVEEIVFTLGNRRRGVEPSMTINGMTEEEYETAQAATRNTEVAIDLHGQRDAASRGEEIPEAAPAMLAQSEHNVLAARARQLETADPETVETGIPLAQAGDLIPSTIETTQLAALTPNTTTEVDTRTDSAPTVIANASITEAAPLAQPAQPVFETVAPIQTDLAGATFVPAPALNASLLTPIDPSVLAQVDIAGIAPSLLATQMQEPAPAGEAYAQAAITIFPDMAHADAATHSGMRGHLYTDAQSGRVILSVREMDQAQIAAALTNETLLAQTDLVPATVTLASASMVPTAMPNLTDNTLVSGGTTERYQLPIVTLEPGQEGEAVAQLQRALGLIDLPDDAGALYRGGVTGTFDARTQVAVARLNQYLEESGEISEAHGAYTPEIANAVEQTLDYANQENGRLELNSVIVVTANAEDLHNHNRGEGEDPSRFEWRIPFFREETPSDRAIADQNAYIGRMQILGKATQTLVAPITEGGDSQITSLFGDTEGRSRPHGGLDFWSSDRDITAPIGGTVVSVDRNGGGRAGRNVFIYADDGREYGFMHFDSIASSIRVGDRIEQGAPLGIMGRTGNVMGRTGIHLHLQVKEARDAQGDRILAERRSDFRHLVNPSNLFSNYDLSFDGASVERLETGTAPAVASQPIVTKDTTMAALAEVAHDASAAVDQTTVTENGPTALGAAAPAVVTRTALQQ